MPEELLTPQEAAEELHLSYWTVLRWIRSGKLPAKKLGHRTIRIRRADLDELVA